MKRPRFYLISATGEKRCSNCWMLHGFSDPPARWNDLGPLLPTGFTDCPRTSAAYESKVWPPTEVEHYKTAKLVSGYGGA